MKCHYTHSQTEKPPPTQETQTQHRQCDPSNLTLSHLLVDDLLSFLSECSRPRMLSQDGSPGDPFIWILTLDTGRMCERLGFLTAPPAVQLRLQKGDGVLQRLVPLLLFFPFALPLFCCQLHVDSYCVFDRFCPAEPQRESVTFTFCCFLSRFSQHVPPKHRVELLLSFNHQAELLAFIKPKVKGQFSLTKPFSGYL